MLPQRMDFLELLYNFVRKYWIADESKKLFHCKRKAVSAMY